MVKFCTSRICSLLSCRSFSWFWSHNTVKPGYTGFGYAVLYTFLSSYRRTQQNWAGIVCMRAGVSIPEFSLYRNIFCPAHTNFLCPVYPGWLYAVIRDSLSIQIKRDGPCHPLTDCNKSLPLHSSLTLTLTLAFNLYPYTVLGMKGAYYIGSTQPPQHICKNNKRAEDNCRGGSHRVAVHTVSPKYTTNRRIEQHEIGNNNNNK
jgi:hypothetical protein